MAADYIDRTALTEQFSTLAIRYAAMGFEEVAQNYNWAVSVLDGAPAADVAEVVRCRACKYVRPVVQACDGRQVGIWCYLRDADDIGEDDFCSRGVRKDV